MKYLLLFIILVFFSNRSEAQIQSRSKKQNAIYLQQFYQINESHPQFLPNRFSIGYDLYQKKKVRIAGTRKRMDKITHSRFQIDFTRFNLNQTFPTSFPRELAGVFERFTQINISYGKSVWGRWDEFLWITVLPTFSINYDIHYEKPRLALVYPIHDRTFGFAGGITVSAQKRFLKNYFVTFGFNSDLIHFEINTIELEDPNLPVEIQKNTSTGLRTVKRLDDLRLSLGVGVMF